jgi:hypothetical protein
MRFGRSAIITAIAASASAGALALMSGGPAAAVDNVTGTGTPTCSAGYAGRFTFSPALVAGGTATNELVQVQLNFSGCAGGTPIPASGRYIAKGVVAGAGANDCANWFVAATSSPGIATRAFSAPGLRGPVTWSPATINGSNVQFSNMKIKTGTGIAHNLTFYLPNTGSGVVTGSYAATSQLVLRVLPAYAALNTSCGGPGVSAVHIVQTTGAGTSTGTW